eukprot:m.890712 g.890712  ORF g.890712 m.890712 type:complete len:56 (+) comp23652_c1_seq10:3441-3608(+)
MQKRIHACLNYQREGTASCYCILISSNANVQKTMHNTSGRQHNINNSILLVLEQR